MNFEENWIQTNLGDTEYFQPQGTGITPFTGTKDYLSTSSVDGNKIASIEAEITYHSRPSRANLQPQPNTVWFARMRETHKVLITSQYLRDHAILSTGFCGIQSEKIDTVYLKQYLSSDFFERQKDRYAEGSTQVALSNIQLPLIKIQFPKSKPEQSKIAEVLSKVDQAIEQTESLIAKQQRIKTGLMQDLLTRGIDEHGNLRSEETHEFKDSPLGRIPVEWEVTFVENLCRQIVDCPHTTPTYLPAGIPCIRTADMIPGQLLLDQAFCVSEEEYISRIVRLIPEEGDIIYSREGERLGIASPVGRERVCLGQRVMLLRPKDDPNYLLWAMNDPSFYNRIITSLGATTSPHINVGDIKKALIFKPSPEEQTAIGKLLSGQTLYFRSITKQIAKFQRIKTALMQDLLTGKVRVTPLLENTEAHS